MNRTCRIGVHGRNNDNFEQLDYEVIRKSNIEAIKVMSQTHPGVIEQIKQINPDIEIITRLFNGGSPGSPEEFVNKMAPIMKSYQPYCQKFHIHNEPNHGHGIEGWGNTDEHAKSFNSWFLEVYDRLKNAHPWAKLGFPGLAVPDSDVHRTYPWLNICRPAIERADWLGVHAYWQSPPGRESVIFNEHFGLVFKQYHKMFPNKIIDILECGNSNAQNNLPISDEDVAREFTDWLNEVFKYPYINSVAYFILSSQDPNWGFFAWRKEDGYVKPIVDRVGQMSRPARTSQLVVQPPVQVQPAEPKPVEPKPVTPATDEVTEPASFTNQNIIDAFHNVGKALGTESDPWWLLSKAGLSLGELISNREVPYSGASLAQLNLTADERRLVREELAEIAPEMETVEAQFTNQNVMDAFYQTARKMGLSDPWALLSKAGFTLGGLVSAGRNDFYNGPRISQNPALTEEEKSLVKQEMRSILGLGATDEIPSFAIGGDMPTFLKNFEELIGVPPAVSKKEQLSVGSAENNMERRICRVWNSSGWILTLLADVLGVDLALAVAIPACEMNDRGLDNDGRMIIRFEVHIFKDKWGKDNPEKFNQHFHCDEDNAWQKHQWRPFANAEWRDCHNKQDSEWNVFEFARTLDDTAAKQSIAMGMTEILGCNYALIGYNSVDEMYNAFASGERCQLIGLFDLISGPEQLSREIQALRDGDIDAFATLYKGSNEAAKYGAMLRKAIDSFRKLKNGN